MTGRRMTAQTRGVLAALLREPGREWYGLELAKEAGLPSGTLYPILARLEQVGWIEGRWEDPCEHVAEGRPRRRYYRLTEDGAEPAARAVQRPFPAPRRPRTHLAFLRPRLAGERP